jgi:hypothetical protein
MSIMLKLRNPERSHVLHQRRKGIQGLSFGEFLTIGLRRGGAIKEMCVSSSNGRNSR